MKIQFYLVVADDMEMYHKAGQEEKYEDMNLEVPYHNEQDTVEPMVVDMLEVIHFYKTYVYYNNQKLDAIKVKTKTYPHELPCILAKYEDFKKLVEMAQGATICKPDDLLKS